MPEIHQTNEAGNREFGGKMGGRKTVWLTVVFSAALIAVGAYYLVPQFW